MVTSVQAATSSPVHGYPARPVRLIVPYAPGGSSDIIARLYGQQLSESMGQTFVVDNRPGAGGVIGTSLLAKATADGYTLILQDMPHTINPAVYGGVPYDPLRDFTPITLVARAPQWLFVHPAVAAKSVRELVALAKSQPGALKIGSAGNGSGTHLMAELLMRGAGIQMTHVPYKGAGPAVGATVGGEMNAVFTSMPAAIAFVQAGRLRPIGDDVHAAAVATGGADVPGKRRAEHGAASLVRLSRAGRTAETGAHPAARRDRRRGCAAGDRRALQSADTGTGDELAGRISRAHCVGPRALGQGGARSGHQGAVAALRVTSRISSRRRSHHE
ncbi:MAG TPA: tripartite tricarboxylate transporter substrate-binding protein [Burkholderiales bacterium]|nr:tripartite tricarboxylate transporter substrate-binding protein [Burkholderiales bacterium]